MGLHLFEWHDQAWFPISLRTAMTSYLTVAYGTSPFPKPVEPRVSKRCLVSTFALAGPRLWPSLPLRRGAIAGWLLFGQRRLFCRFRFRYGHRLRRIIEQEVECFFRLNM
jgi:hypothetical protein